MFAKNEPLAIRFLKCLSKIKGWNYHEKIEKEKRNEIREFIALYAIENVNGRGYSYKGVYYHHLNTFVEHPSFKPRIKALLTLLEPSNNEQEFHQRYQKVTSSQLAAPQLN